MAATATKTDSVAAEMSSGDPAKLANGAEQVRIGDMLAPQKWTIAALSPAATAVDLTSAAVAAVATAGAFTPALRSENGDQPPRLPAVLNAGAIAVRVTGGAAAAGPRTVTDSGGTPSATVCTLSEDGKTLTFEANVTDFVVEYSARAAKDMTKAFASL
jgi:hypothetical protein